MLLLSGYLDLKSSDRPQLHLALYMITSEISQQLLKGSLNKIFPQLLQITIHQILFMTK